MNNFETKHQNNCEPSKGEIAVNYEHRVQKIVVIAA